MHDLSRLSRVNKHQALEDWVDTCQIVSFNGEVQRVLAEDVVLELHTYLEAILNGCVVCWQGKPMKSIDSMRVDSLSECFIIFPRESRVEELPEWCSTIGGATTGNWYEQSICELEAIIYEALVALLKTEVG